MAAVSPGSGSASRTVIAEEIFRPSRSATLGRMPGQGRPPCSRRARFLKRHCQSRKAACTGFRSGMSSSIVSLNSPKARARRLSDSSTSICCRFFSTDEHKKPDEILPWLSRALSWAVTVASDSSSYDSSAQPASQLSLSNEVCGAPWLSSASIRVLGNLLTQFRPVASRPAFVSPACPSSLPHC